MPAFDNHANGINASGQIVGHYRDHSGIHGFVLDNGSYTTLDVPGSTSTFASGINDLGLIVGYYPNPTYGLPLSHGFLLDNGSYTQLTVPDLSGSTYGTSPSGINASGQIVGSYRATTNSLPGTQTHGFLFGNGSYTTLDVPGSISTQSYVFPFPGPPIGINNSAQIVGAYYDAAGIHGFLLENGRYTTLDVPGATATGATGINSLGQIVGYYYDATGKHGFLYENGGYTTLDAPGSMCTQANGINDSGQIVDVYVDAFGTHGFLATPVP